MRIAIVSAFILLLMAPVLWMILGSFQPIEGILSVPPRFPVESMTLGNYIRVITDAQIGRWTLNSAIVVFWYVSMATTVSAGAGYALAHNFKGSRTLMALVVAGLIIPRYVMILPHFLVVRLLGVFDTLIGAALPTAFWPMGILLFRNYVRQIPKELREVARIDGAGEIRIITQVMAPICKPAVATLAVFSGMLAMQDYLWQMLILRSQEKQTAMVGIVGIVMREGRHWAQVNPIGLSLAAGVILFVPMLVFFGSFQKYFLDGIPTGGVK